MRRFNKKENKKNPQKSILAMNPILKAQIQG